ncbi:MAG: DUF4838 domain-containing protein [Lentisphaeria bacterium]|nr:DUF4838 domain-containing protein [Lentisphaeria bacterium]
MMIRFSCIGLTAGLLLSVSSVISAAEVLLLGNGLERNAIRNKILMPNGIAHNNSSVWVKPQEYPKYAAVILAGHDSTKDACWGTGEDISAVKRYLESGGTILICGNAVYGLSNTKRSLKPIEKLVGYSMSGVVDGKKYTGVRFTALGKQQFGNAAFAEGTWRWPAGNAPAKITSAKSLAEYVGAGGLVRPAILVNKVGKGRVYSICPLPGGILRQVRSLGSVDENGVFTLNEDGKRLEALEKVYTDLIKSASGIEIRKNADHGSWGEKPLGGEGKLEIRADRVKQPEFRPPVRPKPVFRLAENGKALAVICCPGKEYLKLAQELKYHLDKMTGANFQITNEKTGSGPRIELSADTTLPPETVIARTEKDHVVLGGHPAGVKLAVFYFLEKLGCRYLWPGEVGKVIPRRPTLDAPEMDLKAQPMLQSRRVRNVHIDPSVKLSSGMRRAGVTDPADEKKYNRLHASKGIDRKGNSSIFTWHGQGKRSHFQYGHALGYLWKKYGEAHPDYFALQPNGSRSQAAAPDRPRLCKSNPALSDALANDVLEYFDAHPDLKSRSVCLNDGGHTSFCLCENCRKLDPTNAPPSRITLFLSGGVRNQLPYVSLTDRVLDFFNRVAEKVTAKYPDHTLSVYIYSVYSLLPVKVKPHPALVLYLTAFSYTNEEARQKQLASYAKWSSFGNKLFFRPNALLGFNGALAPQNYARKIFNDLEFFKTNGLVGTDYDCNEKHWACKGLVYYALLKAHWNPDRMDFDALLDDYCRSGFGPGAEEVKAYFLLLEKLTDQAAASGKPYLEFFDEKAAAQLRAHLDAAEKKAQGDEAVLKRIAFLKLGLTAGDYTLAMRKAHASGDRAKFKAGQNEMRQWLRKTMFESPFAIYPASISRKTLLSEK